MVCNSPSTIFIYQYNSILYVKVIKEVLLQMNKIKNFFKKHERLLDILLIIVGFIIFMSVDIAKYHANKPDFVEYSQFVDDLNNGLIDTIYYNPSDEIMRYTLFNEETKNMTKEERDDYDYDKEYWRRTPFPDNENFREEMLAKGVNLDITSFEPISITILTLIIQILISCLPFILLFFFVFKDALGGIKPNDLIKRSNVRFSDVIGHDEVIDDLKAITDLIKNPSKRKGLNVKVPRGILFSGDSGTGKTLLAKAVAGESEVPFIYMNASNFIELYVGTGAKRVRELFKLARKNAPCIIFIDEIDAIGYKRGSSRNSTENDQTINALLQEMDGFNERDNIFVIASTNNPELLDKALIRSGRFDRQIIIAPPKNWKVRKDIFDFYLKDIKLSNDVDTDVLSKQLVGFTGADINSLVNEAKLIAMLNNKEVLSQSDLEEAIDKLVFKGNRSKSESFKKDKEIVAYHESGHAVMSYLKGEPIARASIISTTSGVGGVVFREEKNSQFLTNEDIENYVCIAYAGRCAEKIKFGKVNLLPHVSIK